MASQIDRLEEAEKARLEITQAAAEAVREEKRAKDFKEEAIATIARLEVCHDSTRLVSHLTDSTDLNFFLI